MANKSLKDILLERDGYLCGIHVGGCGKKLAAGDATVDHIIPRNILKTDEITGTLISGDDAFKQPMCKDCNNSKKHGGLDVMFSCACHSASLAHSDGRFILSIYYKMGAFHICTVKIPLEESGEHLMASGITGDGQFGYRRGAYGGLFRRPFPASRANNWLSLNNPSRVESQQPYIHGRSSSTTIEYEPSTNLIESTSSTLTSFFSSFEEVWNSYIAQVEQLLCVLKLQELELKEAIGFPAEPSVHGGKKRPRGAQLTI